MGRALSLPGLTASTTSRSGSLACPDQAPLRQLRNTKRRITLSTIPRGNKLGHLLAPPVSTYETVSGHWVAPGSGSPPRVAAARLHPWARQPGCARGRGSLAVERAGILTVEPLGLMPRFLSHVAFRRPDHGPSPGMDADLRPTRGLSRTFPSLGGGHALFPQ